MESQANLSRGLVERFPKVDSLRHDLAVSTPQMAALVNGFGAMKEGSEYFERSIALREEILLQRPESITFRRGLMITCGNYASVLGMPWMVNTGEFAKARLYANKAAVIARELVKANPQDATARYDLASVLVRLGSIPPASGQVRESLGFLEESLELLRALVQASPKSFNYVEAASMAHEYAGHRLRELGELDRAESEYRQSLSMIEAVAAGSPDKVSVVSQALSAEQALARILAERGSRQAAIDYANRAVARAEKFWGVPKDEQRHSGYLGRALFTRAVVRRQLGDPAAARESALDALKQWTTIRNPAMRGFYGAAMPEAEKMADQP